MTARTTDEQYMALALDLARKGAGWTSPNPMVGAVIVKDGQVIGQGYHAKCGDLHAERAALANCQGDPAGATIYVTLEPCCHHGRQPPCTDAILEAGITRVVVGSGDPNPLVAGKGLDILRSHGVAVTEGVLDAECKALNDVFFHYIQTGRPYVVLKYAMTLDGKLAAYTGASQWITGEEARRHVHTQRSRFRSIMVGVDTVLADDPQLTCRIEGGRNPLRIICDSHLRTPLSAQVVQTAKEVPTYPGQCNCVNAALANVLAGNNNEALKKLNAENKECPMSYYLKAVIGARTNDATAVIENLKKACSLDASFKQLAATDMEFVKFFENNDFVTITK